MTNGSAPFRIVHKCQQLYSKLLDTAKNLPKSLRYDFHKDILAPTARLISLTRRANDLPAGSFERLALQDEGFELLAQLKDILPAYSRYLSLKRDAEAQLNLDIDNLVSPYAHWMERDMKVAVAYNEQTVRRMANNVYQKKNDILKVEHYRQTHGMTDETENALDEARSRYRIAKADYKNVIIQYDRVVKQLRKTQERFRQDDSALGHILRQIDKEIPPISAKEDIEKLNGEVLSENVDGGLASATKKLMTGNESLAEDKNISSS